MRILIDTNVLVRLTDSSHAFHSTAVSAIDALHQGGHELAVVPQVLYEFWSVATRSVSVNGLGIDPPVADAWLHRFIGAFRLLRDERGIFDDWRRLVTLHEIRGVKSFDARLAAAMLRHGLSHLLTFNAGDFRVFNHVALLDANAFTAT